jgi:hypothetical protein
MWAENEHGPRRPVFASDLAEWTGLEPATPGVTGRYSNQLNYHSPWLAASSTALRLPAKCRTKLGVP